MPASRTLYDKQLFDARKCKKSLVSESNHQDLEVQSSNAVVACPTHSDCH